MLVFHILSAFFHIPPPLFGLWNITPPQTNLPASQSRAVRTPVMDPRTAAAAQFPGLDLWNSPRQEELKLA